MIKRSWLISLVTLASVALPNSALPATSDLDPAYQRIMEQERYVMDHPDDQEARQKLIDYATSPGDGKALIVVGVGLEDKTRHPKQALAMAQRAAQADVYRWLAYHALWQKDPSLAFGSVDAEVKMRGQLIFQGETGDGKVLLIERYTYPLSVTVNARPRQRPTPSPMASATPAPSASPMASTAPSTAPTAMPTATPAPSTAPPGATPSAAPSPSAVPTPFEPMPSASAQPAPVSVPGPTTSSGPTTTTPITSPSP